MANDLRTVRMRIVNREHPHYEEFGYLTGKIVTMRFSGHEMAEFRLENCRHGGDACFVSKGDLARDTLQPQPERPRKRRSAPSSSSGGRP
jgi:hypothetical protein